MWGLEGAAAAWAAYTSARHIATAARVLAIMRGPSLPRSAAAAPASQRSVLFVPSEQSERRHRGSRLSAAAEHSLPEERAAREEESQESEYIRSTRTRNVNTE
eukprot:SAG25_NODE_80_length_16705_cov_9.579746_5_plen_103_part_00